MTRKRLWIAQAGQLPFEPALRRARGRWLGGLCAGRARRILGGSRRRHELQEGEGAKVARVEGGEASHFGKLQGGRQSGVEDALAPQAQALEKLESTVQNAGRRQDSYDLRGVPEVARPAQPCLHGERVFEAPRVRGHGEGLGQDRRG